MTDRPNVLHDPVVYDDADPSGYRGGEVLPRAGGEGAELSVRVFALPAGESLCPYHYEYVEEWLLVLGGELDLRTPAGSERLDTGALVRFCAGPEGGHKVTTPADASEPARLMMFSSGREPAVAVYPDSDKIGVWVPGGDANVMLRRADGRAGYYDGEK